MKSTMKAARRGGEIQSISLADIIIAGNRRAVSVGAVERLAESIDKVGLKHPISIRFIERFVDPVDGEIQGAYVLVAGRHRLEAHRRLGLTSIDCRIEEGDEDTARMWEIAENLHRAELTKLEHDIQVAEWIRLANKVSGQVDPKPQGGRPEGGIARATRELGLESSEAKRAVRVDSLTPEAKEAARDVGLDDNRSALLQAAKVEPERQAETIRELAQAKIVKPITPVKIAAAPLDDVSASERQVARLMDAWNAAGPEARQEFLSRIGTPDFDATRSGGQS